MKKMIIATLTILIPVLTQAGIRVAPTASKPDLRIPSQFSMSGTTKTLEWGCPIENERVESDNKKAAVNHLISQCIEQVSRAAQAKPEVAAVIQASVIAPDLAVTKNTEGAHVINGTIFLQTVVMVRSAQ